MGLFSDIYNTVAKFFRPQEELGDASKSVATNRLKLVLMQDRTNLTPKILEQMRSELIDLLSRYVELDKELLDLNFEQEGNQVALMLSIPVIRAKDEEEIEEAIKAHKEALKDAETETSDTEASDISELSENKEEDGEESISEEEIIDEKSEEEKEEAKKIDEIENELNNVKKIIKRKEVSAPDKLNSAVSKQEETESESKVESSSEA